MTTKERIMEEALSLFAERGYDATGVDLIAERVGIKGPSIYKHFKGKEEILNSIIDTAEERYDALFGSEENIGDIPESEEEFVRDTMQRVSFTMHDPMIRKIRRFLTKEQFRSGRLAEVTTKHQLYGLQRMFTRIFQGMMEKGIVKGDDPSMLALELASPAVLMIAAADRDQKYQDEMLSEIEKHIRHFCNTYMRQ